MLRHETHGHYLKNTEYRYQAASSSVNQYCLFTLLVAAIEKYESNVSVDENACEKHIT